jgi:hypothetical protein
VFVRPFAGTQIAQFAAAPAASAGMQVPVLQRTKLALIQERLDIQPGDEDDGLVDHRQHSILLDAREQSTYHRLNLRTRQ